LRAIFHGVLPPMAMTAALPFVRIRVSRCFRHASSFPSRSRILR
jgi:hypothetical protein